MPKKYIEPPIVEAVCEFRFDPTSDWDSAIPGLIYEKVKDPFKNRRQVKDLLSFELTVGNDNIQQQLLPSDRIQFVREDERALIQVAPHLMSVSNLKPYSSWEEFLPVIRQGFAAYLQEARPKGLISLGLRYINRIEVPETDIKLDKYFRFYPFMENDLAGTLGAFIVGIQTFHEEGRDVLKIQLASGAVEQEGISAFVLDLDYRLLEAGKIELSGAFDWIDVAHGRVESAFESCLTQKLRDLFEEVTE